MRYEPLSIAGAWLMRPTKHGDDRGMFLEWFKASRFEDAVGEPLPLAQANCSVSARGTVRGIHFADVPPGQAKYVTCLAGHVRDVIVDIRVGSPSYGKWTSVELDAVDRCAVYLEAGLGHGFAALADGSTVAYLCSTEYAPHREHEVHPLDPDLAIDWGLPASEMSLSGKDAAAPGLSETRDAGLLPAWKDCASYRLASDLTGS